ncbi:hypothetical protein AN478_12700 [Thiohalorhabdus denitrificans]|uniref:Sulfotransferase family protein n=1 Tax=Thiohalorhabdus denitrificans TaxID=381306 RepID=A0A0P9CR36_9GAMM|nr:sulfotransferase family 2 domain-containing protein [Thiohalorhabdus denitrificans]KPV39143.1 hypothetical protein AN478_12700 [Thiohalorhabdus denitrificans]SCX76551.1 Sulfotransferase family protein [Thiohalorhabdus denitrificans]
MIYSKKENFIFIKTTKTAGSSVEIALSSFCGGEDILTPLTPEDEEKRASLAGIGAQNFEWPEEEKPWGLLRDITKRPNRYRKFLKHPLTKKYPATYKFDEHMSAHDVKLLLGAEIWKKTFTFTIERNPWDRAISFFYWQQRNGKKFNTIDHYVENRAKNHKHKLSNWHLYTKDDQFLVDKVLRYEDLSKDFENLGNFLGLTGLTLPEYQAKGNHRKNRDPAGKLLSKNAIDLIGEVCKKEIEFFGYEVQYD